MPSSHVIGDQFESLMKEQIRRGRDACASEAVREARLSELRSEIQRGADSGASIPAKVAFSPCASASRSPALGLGISSAMTWNRVIRS